MVFEESQAPHHTTKNPQNRTKSTQHQGLKYHSRCLKTDSKFTPNSSSEYSGRIFFFLPFKKKNPTSYLLKVLLQGISPGIYQSQHSKYTKKENFTPSHAQSTPPNQQRSNPKFAPIKITHTSRYQRKLQISLYHKSQRTKLSLSNQEPQRSNFYNQSSSAAAYTNKAKIFTPPQTSTPYKHGRQQRKK